jgi:hypothetical protein
MTKEWVENQIRGAINREGNQKVVSQRPCLLKVYTLYLMREEERGIAYSFRII